MQVFFTEERKNNATSSFEKNPVKLSFPLLTVFYGITSNIKWEISAVLFGDWVSFLLVAYVSLEFTHRTLNAFLSVFGIGRVYYLPVRGVEGLVKPVTGLDKCDRVQ